MTIKTSRYVAYFAGTCQPANSRGTASYGAVIFQDGERIWECSQIYQLGKRHERDVAEYAGLLAVLHWLGDHDLFDARIIVCSNSELVIRQIFGSWSIKNGEYVELAYEARKLARYFTNIRGEWIRRERNEIADRLSKEALKKAGVELRLQPA
jgi:ribonuclease HI